MQFGERERSVTLCVGFLLYNAATPLSVAEFLRKHETEFFSVVNPRLSLLRLKRKGVISEDVRSHINSATYEVDAQEILFAHLMHHANVDALMSYCEVAIGAEGYPNMQSLGRKMKEELQQGWLVGEWLCVYNMWQYNGNSLFLWNNFWTVWPLL